MSEMNTARVRKIEKSFFYGFVTAGQAVELRDALREVVAELDKYDRELRNITGGPQSRILQRYEGLADE